MRKRNRLGLTLELLPEGIVRAGKQAARVVIFVMGVFDESRAVGWSGNLTLARDTIYCYG